MDNLPLASYAGGYTIIVKHHHKMPKSRQKSDAKSSNEEQEEVPVGLGTRRSLKHPQNPGGSQSGQEKRPD